MSKKSNFEKVQADYPDFVLEVERLSVVELEKRLSSYAKEAEKSEQAKENDEKLQQAKEQAREFAAPYNDVKKAIRAKVKYIVKMIEEKGGN